MINVENYYLEALRSPSASLAQKRFFSVAAGDTVTFPESDIFGNQTAGQVTYDWSDTDSNIINPVSASVPSCIVCGCALH